LSHFEFSGAYRDNSDEVVYPRTSAMTMLRDELEDLTRDNVWISRIRANCSIPLQSLLNGRRRPSVLYFALQQTGTTRELDRKQIYL